MARLSVSMSLFPRGLARNGVGVRGRVKAFLLEKVRLATPDEMTRSQFIIDALKHVETELNKRNVITKSGPHGSGIWTSFPAQTPEGHCGLRGGERHDNAEQDTDTSSFEDNDDAATK